ncbi:MAG: hypothetical protein V3T83_10025 [Acidobacteriota bacterium]
MKPCSRLRIGIGLPGERKAQRQDVVGVEAGIHGLHHPQRADHQAGADQQDQSQGHLRHDQQVEDPNASSAQGQAPPPLLERLVRHREALHQERERSEDQAAQHRKDGREEKGGLADRHLVQSGEALRPHSDQDGDSQGGQEQACGAAQETHQNAFGQKVTHDAAAAGAQGRSQSHLPPSSLRPHQEKVAHVGASDQEDEADRSEEQPQG